MNHSSIGMIYIYLFTFFFEFILCNTTDIYHSSNERLPSNDRSHNNKSNAALVIWGFFPHILQTRFTWIWSRQSYQPSKFSKSFLRIKVAPNGEILVDYVEIMFVVDLIRGAHITQHSKSVSTVIRQTTAALP